MKLFLYFLFSGSILLAQNFSFEEEEIKKVLEHQRSAWNKGEIEDYMSGYWKSDSLMFVGSKGIQYGWNKTLMNYKKSYPDKKAMGELTFDILSLNVLSENSAFMLGKWLLKREAGNLSGHFTLLWKKILGEWKVVIDHSS